MSMNDIESLFSFIGGLGMFIYGMNVMADGLQKAAGNKMKQLLGYMTNNRIVGVLVGALVTIIIQSSSATTVMIVGFVNAGLMNLTQAVGVIMGANIGTTVTAWLVSMSELGSFFSPEFYAPLFIGIGAFIVLFAKKQKVKDIAGICIGFGVLFIGLSFMSGAITPYKDLPIFAKAFQTLGSNPIFGILTGTIITGIIQSSAASVSILQTLALSGVVTWNSAIYITLGQNIGTCVTALISSAGANKTAKRAAVIHLLFNVIGAVLFGLVLFTVFTIKPEYGNSAISIVQISIFHTIFNLTNTIILLPFADKLVSLSGVIVKEEEEIVKEAEDTRALRHLDERIFQTPSFAVESAVSEVVHMGKVALGNLQFACEGFVERDGDKLKKVFETEKIINNMESIITEYLVKISHLSLTEKQHITINNLFYSVSDIERVGDHCENIAELGEYQLANDIKFSQDAEQGAEKMMEMVNLAFENALLARGEESAQYAIKATEYEDEVDKLEETLRKLHIERLSKGLCSPDSGVVYLDLINNLERISDHADNLAEYIISEEQ